MKAAKFTSIAEQVEAQIDRSQWISCKFSDLAENINEKISPQSSDLTHYIGLGHLDSGSLKIRRFGDPKAIKGDKLRIYKGDLIFAKRNAYLKRVSVAEFDAIASAHSLVLRAKSESVLPEFLPFFMLSDAFWERAIAISVGSLSPTINWKALAKQEFLLPPKDQQAKLAELLWAGDSAKECLRKGIEHAEVIIATKLKTLFGKSKSNRNQSFDLKKLSECVHLQAGVAKGKKPKNGEKFVSMPYLRVANVQDGHLNLEEIKEISLPEKDVPKYLLQDEDIVICEGGDFDKVGRGAIWRDSVSPCLHQNHVFSLRCDRNQVLPEFLELQLQSNYGKGYFLGCAKKTSNLASINSTQVKEFPLQVARLPEQKAIIAEFRIHRNATAALNSQWKASNNLLKSLINQIF